MNLARIKAVTFGASGVLVRPAPSIGAIYEQVLAQKRFLKPNVSAHQLDAHYTEVAERWHKQHPERWSSPKTGKALWLGLTEDVLKHYYPLDQVKVVLRDLWEAFAKPQNWEEIPGARPVLEILSRCNYSLAIVSNSDSRLSKKILKSLGLASFFQEIFLSTEVGFSKPDMRMFNYVRGVLDLAPHEILHVGPQMDEDVLGALKAGWQAAFLDEGSPSRQDVLYLERLTDLVDVLPGTYSQVNA